MSEHTWIWVIFLDKLGGLVKGIGSLLIETAKSIKAVSGNGNLKD
jgi:hypothetical protein